MPLDGGITNRNWKVGFGGTPYVIREPGKDTDLLGHRPQRRVGGVVRRGAGGRRAPVRAMLEDPPILVTGFVEGAPVTEEELRQPDLLRNVAGALRRMHDSGEELPSTFSAFRIVEEYAETTATRGGTVPDGYDGARKRAKKIEKALRGPDHEPVPCHNDLLAGQPAPRRVHHVDRGLGVRGHGQPLLRSRATWP